MVGLFMLLYMTVLGMTMVLLFLDSRYARGRTVLAVYSTAAFLGIVIWRLYRTVGMEALIRHYTLVVHLPALMLFLLLSRFRGWRLVFQFLSTVLFCMLIQHGAGLVYYLSGGQLPALILAYGILSGGVIWFLLKFLRPLFFQTLMELHRGWWLMCLVMAGDYAIMIYLIPGYVGVDRNSTILKPAISLLMVGFYSLLIFLLSSVRKEAEARYSAGIAALQASALQSRIEEMKAAEEAIRIQRHDLRHALQTAVQLLDHGNKEEAVTFLDAAAERLDQKRENRWCRPPVLDAMFTSYFNQARREGIRVDARIALPENLGADEGELAMAVANALENAIHANLELPVRQREIRCKAVGNPGFLLELANPCGSKTAFDGRGLPVARQEGHGLGVQSIYGFCQKYGAICQFEEKDGWFYMRLIL